MRVRHRSRSVLLAPVVASLALAATALAQEHAGVVTTLEGRVTVARASSPEETLLKFRDAVFVRDRIATGKESFARILLGGRALVTVREYSTVTITEVPGTATVDVGSGRVAVAVARERMRPGDLVEVRTPNAVAGIRGTVIVAEVFDAQRSVITVLKGVIDVTRLDAGRAVGGSTVLNALQQVTVTGAVSAPQTISSDAAQSIGAEFRAAPPSGAPKAAVAAVTQAEVERVAKDMGGAAGTASSDTSTGKSRSAQSDPGRPSDKGQGTESGTVSVATSGAASGATSSVLPSTSSTQAIPGTAPAAIVPAPTSAGGSAPAVSAGAAVAGSGPISSALPAAVTNAGGGIPKELKVERDNGKGNSGNGKNR
jgi:FecR protein